MSHSVMLVDDDPSLLTLMGMIMERAGYVVYRAASGEEALALLNTNVPDIFIVDVMMPGISGFELCQRLRANPQLAKSHIFLLSARTDTASVEEGLQAGADRYLVKPMPTEVLISYIKEALMTGSA